MKFNWGTGIFIFLTVFLLAAASFIIFAYKQGVNLVHKDYYNQGVDYTEQMKVDSRSVQYKGIIKTAFTDGQFVVGFHESAEIRIDSGAVSMYRPSDSKLDLQEYLQDDLQSAANFVIFPGDKLIKGRYILTVYWYSEGLKYEVKDPVFIQ